MSKLDENIRITFFGNDVTGFDIAGLPIFHAVITTLEKSMALDWPLPYSDPHIQDQYRKFEEEQRALREQQVRAFQKELEKEEKLAHLFEEMNVGEGVRGESAEGLCGAEEQMNSVTI